MVVRMRSTRSHTGNRRSHHALKQMVLSKCADCGSVKPKHTVCLNCGKYKGRIVIDVNRKIEKKAKKQKKTASAVAK